MIQTTVKTSEPLHIVVIIDMSTLTLNRNKTNACIITHLIALNLP